MAQLSPIPQEPGPGASFEAVEQERAAKRPGHRRLASVKRVLLTGMSGTGKSSVVRALAARGYKAADTDDGWCEPLPDGRQRWRQKAIEGLLATEDLETPVEV
jgi:hypothetical protein